MSSIRNLIADDSFAISFQSMGQYRTALLKALDVAPPAPPAPEAGEVGELVAELNRIAKDAREAGWVTDAQSLTRAATLLVQQQHLLGLACQELDNFMEQQLSAPAPVAVPDAQIAVRACHLTGGGG